MKHLSQQLNEGLIEAFKIKKLVVDVQAQVAQMAAERLEKASSPKAFYKGIYLMDAIRREAIDLYEKTMKGHPDALSSNDWWKQFSESYGKYLDATVFDEIK